MSDYQKADRLLTPGTIKDSAKFYDAVHVLVQKRVIYPCEERLAWSARARVLGNPNLRDPEGAFLKFFIDPSTQKYLTAGDEEQGGLDMHQELERRMHEDDEAPDQYAGQSPEFKLPEPRVRPLTAEEMDEKIVRAQTANRFQYPDLRSAWGDAIGKDLSGLGREALIKALFETKEARDEQR